MCRCSAPSIRTGMMEIELSWRRRQINTSTRSSLRVVLSNAIQAWSWGCLSLVLSAAFGASSATGQVLFDGATGTLPAAQGWLFIASVNATQTQTNNSVSLDTSLSTSTQGGYTLISPVPLNRTNGFTLSFNVQIQSETHANTNRAGFSIILLDNEQRGVELGFWADRIFAQSDSPLFVHSEDVSFVTSNSFVTYCLSFFSSNYVLRANGETILHGPIRDYTAFNGFLNPYRTPNLMFLGDDTMSAAAVVSLQKVVLQTPPVLEMAQPRQMLWHGIPGKEYLVQKSSDLAM